MNKVPVLDVAPEHTVLGEDTELVQRTGCIWLLVHAEVEDENRVETYRVNFSCPAAMRFRADAVCTLWHVERTYKSVCEIENSDWMQELVADANVHFPIQVELHHYMIYLEEFGCTEVIANSVSLEKVVDSKQSIWTSPRFTSV